MTWYRKAADQGNALAAVDIGDLYRDGHGVPQDYAQALNWYRNAAEQGNPDGQFNLASLLEHGQGTAVDVNQAVSWYRRAAEQGNNAAAEAVKRLTGQAVTVKK
jgi:TPR repeat protein